MTLQTFNGAQTFWVDPSLVQNATDINISAIDLFFKSKPNAINNVAGIQNPGVSVFISEVQNEIPFIDPNKSYTIARLEHEEILGTSDASVASKFRFPTPVSIKTGIQYAFVFKFDGGAEFILWRNKEGENLVGTTTITPGATGKNSGKFFDFLISNPDPSGNTFFGNINVYQNNWRAQNDTDLKYRVYVARFSHSGFPVGSNTGMAVNVELISFKAGNTETSFANGEYFIPGERVEFITFDQSVSIKEAFVGGQMAYQNTFAWPGGYIGGNVAQKVAVLQGNVNITANANFPNGVAFNWANVFNNYAGDKYLVLKDTSLVNIRKVVEILSNTVVIVDEPLTFTNSQANFLLTPVGQIDQFNKSSPFGLSESFILLTKSSANSSLRFVNNTVESISITNGGTGYNNGDIIYINGWEQVAGKVVGGYRGQANLQTNTSGGITAIYLSNSGAGFVNASAMVTVVGNSSSSNTTSNTSAGSGLVLVYTVGATLKTELRANNNFRNMNVVNIPLSDVIPFFELDKPSGTDYELKLETRYHRLTDNTTLSGFAYYIDTDANSNIFTIEMFKKNLLNYSKVPTFVSRSNEFNTLFANGSPNSLLNANYSGTLTFHLNIDSNNDFSNIFVNSSPQALFSKYLINNDYTNEHTDRGNAWAKGLTTKISFKETRRLAEDLVVILTAYKPVNTDIQVYARIYNNQDPEAIDDKDWTRLEVIDGQNLVSSSIDTSNYIELTYGFQDHPNVEFTLAGSITVSNNETNLVGTGTTFSSNLAVGDLIRVYPALFPNTNIIAVVNVITNNTLLTINSPITNNSFLGTTLKVDKLAFKHQAFNNIMNENVVRYYNASMIEFDGYNSIQCKLVMLSDTPNKIPRIDDIRGAAVTP